MNWFMNLYTKTKLLLLAIFMIVMMIIITAFGFYANMESVRASEDISVILERSFTRVHNTDLALRAFDNEVLTFFGEDEGHHSMNVSQFKSDVTMKIGEINRIVNIMNENKVGDLDSSTAYKDAILRIKKETSAIAQQIETSLRYIETDKYKSFQAYLSDVRPVVIKAVTDFDFLLKEQCRLVTELSKMGADMTPIYISIAISIIAIILGAFTFYLISAYISNSIQRQALCVKEMSSGNFTFPNHSYHDDDFGHTLANLQSMRDSLNKALGDVIASSNATKKSLGLVADESRSIIQNSEECQSKTLTVAAASEEMVSTTNDIAKNCDDASAMSSMTKDIIDNGVGIIQNTIEAIRHQSNQIQANSVAVDKVATRSKDISSIVNTIDEIAAQTNLLALNAAIEAARAGEAGRGFAVVADEVRALASRTASSTQEIAKMVSDIQNDAVVASESISNSVVSMEATSKETAEVENIMNNIVEHINTVNLQITQIASAADEQNAATTEISANIHSITELSQGFNQSSINNDKIITETVESLKELDRSLSIFTIKQA